MNVQPQHHPPVPSVPSIPADAANHGLRARRRSSLPPMPIDSRTQKRSPNYIRTHAASPEIISSLIDQLSAISISAQNHFENLPTGYGNSVSSPASPALPPPSFGRDSFGFRDGSSGDHSSQYSSVKDLNHLYSDDACEPPVIRTSKPPSGLSPLTAPKKREKEHSLRSYIGRSGGSSCSIHSAHSGRSVSSFGNISIEAGVQRQVSNGSARSSIESKRSTKGHRSLMYMSSRERLRLKDAERKRTTIQGPEVLSIHDTPRKAPIQLSVSEDTIKEEPITKDEPVVAESSRAAQRWPSRGTSPLRKGLNLLNGASSSTGSPKDQGLIPERGSSLRHSGSPSRRGRKGHSRRGSRNETHTTTNTVPEEEEEEEKTMDPEALLKEKILRQLEQEDDEVAQRIRELKKQKLLRDKLAGKLPAGVDAGASASPAPVSPLSSPEPSPTSTVSTMSEKRTQDPSKAHKVLGIVAQSSPPENDVTSQPEPKVHVETHKSRHTRTRSLTVNDGDDLTPLPINYKLALQVLEQTPTIVLNPIPTAAPPPPPSSSAASTKDTISSGNSLRRSKSVAVGGRSAVSRKSTNSVMMGGPPTHKHSTSVTNSRSSNERQFRSASEDIAVRHHSLSMASSSAAYSLQHKSTIKKKRWSHPDLPQKAEQRHNDKVDAMRAAAVQRPPQPVIEERPASTDSIDVDVDNYLNSPRLSQKIRHPQTGRVISFSEVGDPKGYAIFVCVGMGLTRYVMAFYDQLAATLKLRLITPDRPGIGDSQVDPNGTPLSWPDDVLVICQALKITKFSLLAHSAGAVYALATSLRMPQHIRGRVHLLAPWIPPSQMAPIGISQDQPPTQQLPRSQRFLRALPPSLLKVANSTFLSATSASLQRTGPKNSPKARRKSMAPNSPQTQNQQQRPTLKENRRESMMMMDQVIPNMNASSLSLAAANPSHPNHESAKHMKEALTLAERERQRAYDERLTFAIWDRATTNANPATDLIVCLETKQSIGFRYEDINRAVVIHHGSKDSRVPADNVRWLGRLMRKCEVRILEGEQHGLMASAQVMGNVLTEMASDWEDWTAVVKGDRTVSRRRTAERLRIPT